MNKNIYRQYDSRWRSLPYPTSRYSFANNGCGCCACTHVIIELDKYKNYTPKNVRPYMVNNGFATKGHGTTWSGIKKTLEHFGFSVINHSTMTDLFKTLDKRKAQNKPCLGVILFRAGVKGGVRWTSGGHYVMFANYKVSGGKHYFYTKDSGGRKHDGWYCYETTMKGLIPQIWSAIPKDSPAPKPTPTPTPYKPSKISVDGDWGKGTTKLTQSVMKTTIDGIISSQPSSYKPYVKGANTNSWQFVSKNAKGSATVKAIQKMVGANQDGKWGQATSKAVQKWLNKQGYKLSVDGDFGKGSVKAFQRWLNTQVR